MTSYTLQFKHKNNPKASFILCRKVLDDICTHVTSSAASRDSAVILMTDSYQLWVAHLNLRVTFQSHIRFARKVQNYGDAFSKSSSILRFSQLPSAAFLICTLCIITLRRIILTFQHIFKLAYKFNNQ